jgi:poly-beta-1,6-N-acetyl-D-glucosamine N-deacetylase
VDKLYTITRNFFCGSLAVAVIAFGRVRRARKRAFNNDVVSAIYFHNPNKRLFARCVQWLAKNGYAFISDDDLIKILHHGLKPPKGAVWLSFDDGFKELLESVVPLVRQRHIPITLFVPSGIVQTHGLFPWLHKAAAENCRSASASARNGMRDSINVADVRELARYPEVNIGSHTVWHTVTMDLSDERACFEFGESKRVLESWTGGAVKTFAYPEGRLSGSEGRILAERGYLLAATTEASFVTPESDPYLVPRFNVGDNISFPEAICNMVGVWRPAINPLSRMVRSLRDIIERLLHTRIATITPAARR